MSILHQINFVRKLEEYDGATMWFHFWEAAKILTFSLDLLIGSEKYK